MKLINLLAMLVLAARLAKAGVAVDTQSLEPRVKQFWAAEVKPDYDAVYGMLSKGEQDSIAREAYVKLRTEIGPFHYQSARLGDIEFSGDLAWVHVNYEFTLPRYPMMPPRTFETWQLWRYQDGWYPIPVAERDRWPTLPPKLRPAAEEAALTKRAAGLWQAKVDQDWKRVYGYLLPGFRARIPLDEFLKSKARFIYIEPRVEWVEASGNEARVSIAYLAKLNDPAVSKMKPEEQRAIEPWVKVDGDWYLDTSVLDKPPADAQGVIQEPKR